MILNQIGRHSDFCNLQGLAINTINEYGNSPLHLVCTWNDSSAVLELIENGADVNCIGEGGMTPLHWAIQNEDLDTVQLLLVNGARNLADEWGITPLQLARNLRLRQIADLLANCSNFQ